LALIPKFRSDPVFPMTAPFQPFIAAQPSVDPDADAELYKRDQPQIRPSEQRGWPRAGEVAPIRLYDHRGGGTFLAGQRSLERNDEGALVPMMPIMESSAYRQ
jgi:hypothetical protein